MNASPPMRLPNLRTNCRAFTRIELLAVLAALALVGAPAFAAGPALVDVASDSDPAIAELRRGYVEGLRQASASLERALAVDATRRHLHGELLRIGGHAARPRHR